MFQFMTTPNNRIAHLREMIALEEKRAVLQGQIADLDSKLSELKDSYGSGATTAPAAVKRGPGRPAKAVAAPTPSGRKGRGALREQILQALSAAGPQGVTVQELATLLNTKTTNIHSWFSTNAKKVAGLKKVGEAQYAIGGGASAPAAPAAAPAKRGRKPKAAAPAVKEKAAPAAKAAPAKAAKGKRGGSRRGEMKDQILAELRKAGKEGITIKDLADKIGANYKNVYIWFVTTGKRVEGIEKVGPARYKLNE